MPEDLTAAARVTDDFSSTLDDLADDLTDVGLLAEDVFPIDADIDGVSQAVTELETLDAAISDVDETATVDVETNFKDITPQGDILEGGYEYDASLGGDSIRDLETGRAAGDGALLDVGQQASFDVGMADIDAGAASISASADGGTTVGDGGRGTGVDTSMSNAEVYGVNPAEDDGVSYAARDHDVLGTSVPTTVLDEFGEKLSEIDLRMGDFYSVLANMAPLLITFIGAMPAAITALIGLAGAAAAAAGAIAAIGGLGVMGIAMTGQGMQWSRVQQQIREIATTFRTAFRPLAEQFAPLVLHAVDEIRGMIRELAASGSVLVALKDEFRGLVHYVTANIPPLAVKIAALGNAIAPFFAAMGQFAEGAGLIDYFAQQLGEMLPLLVLFGSQLGAILPVLISLSEGFFVAATMVLSFISGFFTLIDIIPHGVMLFGVLVGLLFSAYSIAYLLGGAMSFLGSVYAFVAGEALTATLGMEALTLAEIQATFATWQLVAALTVLTGGVLLAIGGLVTAFSSMSSKIGEATSKLKNFERVSNRLDGTSVGFGGATTSGGAAKYVNYSKRSTYEFHGMSQTESNRAAETMSYQENYTEGKDADSEFSGGGY